MSVLTQQLQENFTQTFEAKQLDFENGIVNSWAYLSSPYNMLGVLVIYLAIVLKIGPQLMANRKPFELRKVILCYNLFQVAFNCFLVYLYYEMMGKQTLRWWENVCHPVTAANNYDRTKAMSMLLYGMYFYYLNKIIDLLDTVFFIMRKKDNQVSFLHVFHHVTMVSSTWASIFSVREEISATFAFINCVIHIVMYTYYFLSAFGPEVQKYLWWKRYITKMQIIQFLMVLFCLGKMLFQCSCDKMFWLTWSANISAFLGLFTSFYIQTYSKRKPKEN